MQIHTVPPVGSNPEPLDPKTANRKAEENLRWALAKASEYAQSLGQGFHNITLKHHYGLQDQHLDEEDLSFLDWHDLVMHYEGPDGPCCAEIGGIIAGYGTSGGTTPHARPRDDILTNIKSLVDDFVRRVNDDDPGSSPADLKGVLDTIEG